MLEGPFHQQELLPLLFQSMVSKELLHDCYALGWSYDMVPLVTWGNTLGVTLGLAGMGAVYGFVTYNERKNEGTLMQIIKTRGKYAAYAAGVGGLAGLIYQGFAGTGQKTGWY